MLYKFYTHYHEISYRTLFVEKYIKMEQERIRKKVFSKWIIINSKLRKKFLTLLNS